VSAHDLRQFAASSPSATASRRASQPIVRLLGVPLDNITAAEAIDRIAGELSEGRGGWVLTPNLDILRVLARDPEYAALCSPTTLRVADGMPLIWASRLQRTPLPERIAGSDLIWTLTARAAQEGRSVFFLGGNPGAADDAVVRLKEQNPTLRVAGTECPPMGFEKSPEYLAGLERRLCSAAPDICYVALGPPKQDRLIRRLMPLLPGTWFLGVGISFSYVSGEVHRAPVWMRRIGLEWVHRLVQEPRRLGKRYLIHGIPFAVCLLGASAIKGLGVGRAKV
jgi:N-acetylglucosaminyldiphosphoundecaprenol N-acetyl-beta-D-mannosaminyltransferase